MTCYDARVTNGGRRPARHRLQPVLLLALVLGIAGCTKTLGATGVELELVTDNDAFLASSYELRWFDADKFLFPLRVPETGRLDLNRSRRINVLIEIESAIGERRVLARGLRDGAVVSEAATRIKVDRGYWTLVTLTMGEPGTLLDEDSDGMPNAIDNCPRLPDPCDGSGTGGTGGGFGGAGGAGGAGGGGGTGGAGGAGGAAGRDAAPPPTGDGSAGRPGDAGAGPDAAASGLRGDYFNDEGLTVFRQTRADAQIDFDWGTGSPFAAMNTDRFSVRWTGQLQAPATAMYTLFTQCDDAVRVFVGNTLVINTWNMSPPREHMASINLSAGQRVDLRVEYYETIGDAYCRLLWQSASIAKQVVPSSQLLPAAGGS